MLQKYDHCDSRPLYEIVTGDEIWIKFTETTRKQQSKSWLPKNSNPPEKARPDFSKPKVLCSIFFHPYRPVTQIPVPKGG